MSLRPCPTESLATLIDDSQPGSDEVLAHVEQCESCQRRLEAAAATPDWWRRAERGLSGIPASPLGVIDEPAAGPSFVDTILHPADTDSVSANESAIADDMPRHVDEFEIGPRIGQGGMGIVFRGFDRTLQRPVAIKVMSRHLSHNGVARQRFAREARAAATVVHPHVVPIYRVSDAEDCPYIAMALVDGRSLQDRVSEQGPLSIREAVGIAMQVADGLRAAHAQGLVHRDIKPANILMEKDSSRVLITDFGLARAVDELAVTQSGCVAGTPHYMSPEQISANTIRPNSDLFSLGGVLYFMLTGHEAFRGANAFAVITRIVHDTPISPRRFNAEVPEPLDRIILRLLEKDPKDRFESADQLHGILTKYLAHLQGPAEHPPPAVAAPASRRRRALRQLIVGLTAGAAFTLAAVGVWHLASASSASNDLDNTSESKEHNEHAERDHPEHSPDHRESGHH